MKVRLIIVLLLPLLLVGCKKNKEKENLNLKQLTEKHYSSQTEQPGGVVYLSDGGEVEDSFQFGLSDLEKEVDNSVEIPFRMASVSKHFTAYSIYQLIRQEKLSLDTKINEVLEEMHPVYKEVTVGHLLNHSSGILDYEELIPADQEEQLSDRDVFDLVKSEEELYFSPGTRFKYSNTGYCLLTLITERISEKDYSDYMQKEVFEPLQLHAEVYQKEKPLSYRAFGYHPSPSGDSFAFADQSLTSATKGDGGVYISALDFSKWSRSLMEEINAEEAYAQLLENNKKEVTSGVFYSLGWFIFSTPQAKTNFYVHSGETTGFNNIVVLNPKEEVSLSLFMNRDDELINSYFDEIVQAYELDTLVPAHLFQFLSDRYADREI